MSDFSHENALVTLDTLENVTMGLIAQRNELAALLREAQDMLAHGPCVDDDALKCPGCSLEARIQEALR